MDIICILLQDYIKRMKVAHSGQNLFSAKFSNDFQLLASWIEPGGMPHSHGQKVSDVISPKYLSMPPKSKSAIIEEIKASLFSNQDEKVAAALAKTREVAEPTLVEPLLAFYATTSNPSWKTEAADMLSTLKVSKVNHYFIEALSNPSLLQIRRDVLSFIWNSNLQPVEDFVAITQVALTGSLEETIECLSILENLEQTIPEAVVLECISMIGQFVPDKNEVNKNVLIHDFLAILESHRLKNDLD